MKYYKPKESNLMIGSIVPDQHLMDHSWIALINKETKQCESITGMHFPLSGEYTLDNKKILEKAQSIEQANLYKYSHHLFQILKDLIEHGSFPNYQEGKKLIEKIENIDEPFSRLIQIPTIILKDI